MNGPKLLVSVRNVHEAGLALTAGVEIVDVKEPSQGSLGCAAPAVIDEISLLLQRSNPERRPLFSLALGEVADWCSDMLPERLSAVRHGLTHWRPEFLKMGLAGLMQQPFEGGDWKSSRTAAWTRTGQLNRQVTVAYADSERAGAPHVSEMLNSVAGTGSRILLIDTWKKDGSTLLDWLPLPQLLEIRQDTSQRGVELALAGSVGFRELSDLCIIRPDIIGVRGCVCREGQRDAELCPERLSRLKTAVSESCRGTNTPPTPASRS